METAPKVDAVLMWLAKNVTLPLDNATTFKSERKKANADVVYLVVYLVVRATAKPKVVHTSVAKLLKSYVKREKKSSHCWRRLYCCQTS